MIHLIHFGCNYHRLTNIDADLYAKGEKYEGRVDITQSVMFDRKFTALEQKWFYQTYKKLDVFWKGQERGPPARLDDLINQGFLTVEDGETAIALARELAQNDATWSKEQNSSWLADSLVTLAMTKKFYLCPKKILRPRKEVNYRQ